MKCSNCNFEVADNTKFCPECGTKMPTASEEATFSNQASDESANVVTSAEINEQKSDKKKKTKKIIIISASALLACGIIFLVLYLVDPFCMFRHNFSDSDVIEPTCVKSSYYEYICANCGTRSQGERLEDVPALGHNYVKGVCVRCGEKRSCTELGHELEKGSCGTPRKCIHCGESQTIEHELAY